ncbi:probable oligosaccharyltransferase alpha subunit [Ramularia collo-cygni]|uniref:Dolichyl-diphosphooligosaccharide--protein glycosyltransferase subunit 1 n=1 Tax=Ramularia collo-cygni TaxID=112498 RepID=A0A2D3ULR2_9PEZI|nr:probable oligosaccharyltransferase alpha subunit [Ramularia collo-cygni]CZT14141.1 probable oligosaccharyltransferase alpha subunit [Ramularia collo-cygni]
MRVLQWAVLGLTGIATAADSNLTSRNILPGTFTPPPAFKNVNLVRNINLEKAYPRETLNVVIENVAKTAQQDYFLPFEQGLIGRVGGLEVKDKKQPERSGFSVEVVAIDPQDTTEYYKITLPTALAPAEQLTLSITYHILSALTPLPALIAQNDKQYVLHKFSAYAPSAYPTLKQKTKLKLPTTDVPDVVKLPSALNAEGKDDPQKQGSTFTYGPYGELEAGAVQEVSLRYEFTKPLTHVKLLERDVEVSHWGGNIATEERHWLTNRAAGLKNHFSRVAYQQSSYYNPPTSALKELRFPLVTGSLDPYFVDDIGNVSTSRFRSNVREANLELKPRYPIFGGWNYNFKVGWNGELQNFLRRTEKGAESFVLKVPFLEGPKQAEGVEYEKVVTRVILPEGASNVRFETTVPLISNTTTLVHSFMDTLGRTTLTLTAINVVDDMRDRELLVVYDYPFAARFRKPLTIFGGVMLVFVVSWVVGNLDVSIGKKQIK